MGARDERGRLVGRREQDPAPEVEALRKIEQELALLVLGRSAKLHAVRRVARLRGEHVVAVDQHADW